MRAKNDPQTLHRDALRPSTSPWTAWAQPIKLNSPGATLAHSCQVARSSISAARVSGPARSAATAAAGIASMRPANARRPGTAGGRGSAGGARGERGDLGLRRGDAVSRAQRPVKGWPAGAAQRTRSPRERAPRGLCPGALRPAVPLRTGLSTRLAGVRRPARRSAPVGFLAGVVRLECHRRRVWSRTPYPGGAS